MANLSQFTLAGSMGLAGKSFPVNRHRLLGSAVAKVVTLLLVHGLGLYSMFGCGSPIPPPKASPAEPPSPQGFVYGCYEKVLRGDGLYDYIYNTGEPLTLGCFTGGIVAASAECAKRYHCREHEPVNNYCCFNGSCGGTTYPMVAGSEDGTNVFFGRGDVTITRRMTGGVLQRFLEQVSPPVVSCTLAAGKTLTTSNVIVSYTSYKRTCVPQDCSADVISRLGAATVSGGGQVDLASLPFAECVDCDVSFHYECTRFEKPTRCCADKNNLCSTSQGLRKSEDGSYDSHLTNTQVVELQDISDPSKQGKAIGNPAASRLVFDRSKSGLSITAMRLAFNDFVFDGKTRKEGSAILAGSVTAAPVAGDPNAYAIPAGAAQFSILAVDFDEYGYSVGATNSTSLAISQLDNWSGPRVTGTLTGSVGGHAIEARLDAPFAWDNRPPTAVATVSNAAFHSSQLEPCKSNPNDRRCKHQNCDGTTWIGLDDATISVRLDGSASNDPDPGDTLIYSWDLGSGKVQSNGQPVARAELAQGAWKATLLVQDQHGASSVATVTFVVTDLDVRYPDFTFCLGKPPTCGNSKCEARENYFNCHQDCAPRPKNVPTKSFAPFGDPLFTAPALSPVAGYDYAKSDQSIPVTKFNKSEIKALVGRTSGKVLRAAKKVDFGVPSARQTPVPDPFSGPCGSPDGSLGTSLVCTGYCGNLRCDPTESCSTCPGDCGPCVRCGDGRCDAGESCSDCQADCGDCSPCGNGRCEASETITSCAADCYCGDGLCEAGEGSWNCDNDCYCGNATCDPGETSAACASDCRCGDRICDESESLSTCPADCSCGNGVCDPSESNATCSADCFCGNGQCDGTETAADCPADCPSKRVFLTSAYTPAEFLDGNLGGITGSDALCQGFASAAGLSGIFKAWLSDGVSDPASTFVRSTVPYVKLYGSALLVVADNWADLTDGTLQAAIDTDVYGNHGGYNRLTNVNPDGTTSETGNTCQGFTSNSCADSSRYGQSTTSGSWTLSPDYVSCCTKQFGVMCFEQ